MRLIPPTPTPSPCLMSLSGGREEETGGAAHEGHATRLNAAGGVGSQWRAPSPQVKPGAKSLKSLSVGGCDRALSVSALPMPES